MSTWCVMCDGGCPIPNGPGSYGFVIKEGCTIREAGEETIPEGGITKVAKAGFRPSATNNVMEYSAVTAAAWFILSTLTRGTRGQIVEEMPKVRFFGDSQLIQRQLTGRYQVRDRDLFPHYEEAQKMLTKLRSITEVSLHWFRREHNFEADDLCNEMLRKHGVDLKKPKVVR